jgi:hypothetical protein
VAADSIRQASEIQSPWCCDTTGFFYDSLKGKAPLAFASGAFV